MTEVRQIPISERMRDQIDAAIRSGQYTSEQDVVAAALDLLADRAARLAALDAALAEGEASGPAEPFDFDAFIAERRRGLAAAE